MSKKKIIVYLPAYNSARTLKKTVELIPKDSFDELLLVDDGSKDQTIKVARRLKIPTVALPHNVGYGGNQKVGYLECLRRDADIVMVLHPDAQYDPRKVPEMVKPILEGKADVVMGSRFLPNWKEAVRGNMPTYKIVFNQILTFFQNLFFGTHFAETHTGCWAYSRKFLETVPFLRNGNGWGCGSQLLAQAIFFDFKVIEIPVFSRYHKEMSSTNLKQSLIYGSGALWSAFDCWLNKHNLHRNRLFMR